MEQNQILGINTKPDLTFRLLVELSCILTALTLF